MIQLPHDWVATICASLSVLILMFVGLRMTFRMWGEYQKQYIAGAETTLDAMYITMPAQNILYLSIVCFLGTVAIMTTASGSLYVGIPFGVPMFFAPRIALFVLKRRRDTLFEFQLEDALMNISNSLRAGFSLPQALELIHREMPDPMSQEIRLVCQELRLGLPAEEALDNLYRRMPLQDVDLMVSAIVIVREVGGNLTEVFENIARTLRERHRIEGKIRALTAQGRMQAFVVCSLPFLVAGGLHFINPGLFEKMYTTMWGWAAIGLILILEIVGGFFIYKIVDIDV